MIEFIYYSSILGYLVVIGGIFLESYYDPREEEAVHVINVIFYMFHALGPLYLGLTFKEVAEYHYWFFYGELYQFGGKTKLQSKRV